MLPKSILQGYDSYTRKRIAEALGITLKDKHKGGDHHRMKIPMGALKKDKNKDKKKSAGMKMSMLKKMDKEDKGEKNFKKNGEDE